MHSFVLAVLFIHSFNVLSRYFYVSFSLEVVPTVWILIACEQTLRPGALWRRGGKRKVSSQLRLWSHQFPCGSPSTELSDFRQRAWSGNEREVKKRWKTRDVSANQHFASTFSMQIFKIQRPKSCKLSYSLRRAVHLGDIVKSSQARSTREKTWILLFSAPPLSRELSRLASLAQIGELASRLEFW